MGKTIIDTTAESIRADFEAIDGVRETAYKRSRDLTKSCAMTIRAIHRTDWDEVDQLMAETRRQAAELIESTTGYPQIYWAGYTQDCLKEYVEAEYTLAFIRDVPPKSYEELGVSGAAYLNGIAEASSELRRRILDIIRHQHTDEVERLLRIMEDVYSLLITFDFRDAITNNLRKRTDQVRAVLERTRGDVTTSLRQQRLEEALASVEKRLNDQA